MKALTPDDRSSLVESLFEAAGRPGLDSASEATMSWEQARALLATGVTFGSHTATHPLLPQLAPGDSAAELCRSRAAIESELGRTCRLLAYPNGSYTSEIRNQAAAAGYHLAFTTEPASWMPECDPLRVPRFNMSEGKLTAAGNFSPALFEYATVWKGWRALRRQESGRSSQVSGSQYSNVRAPATAAECK